MRLQSALRSALRGVYATRPRYTPDAELLRLARELAADPTRLSASEIKFLTTSIRTLEKEWSLTRAQELRLKQMWSTR